MPKKVITKYTKPIILHELDKWTGKLTWDRFADHLSKILEIETLSRHTLIKDEDIFDYFNDRKGQLKEEENALQSDDRTRDMLIEENRILQAKIVRLEKERGLFREQFVRWLDNLRKMPGVDMNRLNKQLKKPLPRVNRR